MHEEKNMFAKTNGKYYILKINKEESDDSSGGSGDIITAKNVTGSSVSEGDKVWVNFDTADTLQTV
jgi:hypothetical protein